MGYGAEVALHSGTLDSQFALCCAVIFGYTIAECLHTHSRFSRHLISG
jgi:hypothetical protein